jgi:uncharacterized sulfatase
MLATTLSSWREGQWSKHNSLFEVAARVPLIVCLAAKRGVAAGTTQLLDIYPTLCEACGLPLPAGLEGHSLVRLARDPQAAWEHPAYTVARNGPAFGQSVRTERWRYSEWNGGDAGSVLFDHDSDPHEMKNLADEPSHAGTVKEMKLLLSKLPGKKTP